MDLLWLSSTITNFHVSSQTCHRHANSKSSIQAPREKNLHKFKKSPASLLHVLQDSGAASKQALFDSAQLSCLQEFLTHLQPVSLEFLFWICCVPVWFCTMTGKPHMQTPEPFANLGVFVCFDDFLALMEEPLFLGKLLQHLGRRSALSTDPSISNEINHGCLHVWQAPSHALVQKLEVKKPKKWQKYSHWP